MHPENLAPFHGYLPAPGGAAAPLDSRFTLSWLAGYVAPTQTRPSLFDGGPARGRLRGGELTLTVADSEAAADRPPGRPCATTQTATQKREA